MKTPKNGYVSYFCPLSNDNICLMGFFIYIYLVLENLEHTELIFYRITITDRIMCLMFIKLFHLISLFTLVLI